LGRKKQLDVLTPIGLLLKIFRWLNDHCWRKIWKAVDAIKLFLQKAVASMGMDEKKGERTISFHQMQY